MWREEVAAAYLETLVFSARASDLPEPLRRHARSAPSDTLTVANWWIGIYGIVPGTGSGSQSVEAFHSSWRRCSSSVERINKPHDGLSIMQYLYKDGLADIVPQNALV